MLQKYKALTFIHIPTETFKSNYDNHFTTVGTAGVDPTADYFAGVVFNCSDVNIANSINDGLKFRVVRKVQLYYFLYVNIIDLILCGMLIKKDMVLIL